MFCDDWGKLRIIVIAFLTIDGLVFEKFLDILRVLRELPLFLFCLVLSVDFSNNLFTQSGGGVVYDSDPEKEYEETINKAKAIITAAEDSYKHL